MADAENQAIFVLGLHRGRTTLVQRLLNCHRDVVIWGEHGGIINLYRDAYEQFKRGGSWKAEYASFAEFAQFADKFVAWANFLTHDGYGVSIREHVQRMFHPAGARERWGFKEIRYNNLGTMEFLRELFPRGKFVLVRRAALATFKSEVYVAWSALRGRSQLADFAADYVQSYHRQIGVFEDFARAHPDSARIVAVDDLGDGRATVEAMLAFADLDPDRMDWRLSEAVLSREVGSSRQGARRGDAGEFTEADIEAAFDRAAGQAALRPVAARGNGAATGEETVSESSQTPPGSPAVSDIAALESQAQAARASGDRAGSLAAFRQLVRLAPDQWRFAVGLAHDLHATGEPEQSDDVLRRTVQRFPEEFWPAYHWAFNAMRARRFDLAEGRARRLLDRFARDHRSHELVGDVAMAQKDFAAAARHYEQALAQQPDSAHAGEKLGSARLYERTTRRMAAPARRRAAGSARDDAPDYAPDYAIGVVNLDRSRDRLAAVTAAFRDCPIEPVRIPAVAGSHMPALAAKLLGRHEQPLQKGSLGTFLSQIAGWELMLRSGHRWWLMLEDDAAPLIVLPANIGDLGIPEDFDLCFANRRMERRLSPAERDRIDTFQVFSPIETVGSFPADFRAPGTDGYFLSAKGARQLLAFLERDGFGSYLDWRLLAYSMRQEDVGQLPADTPAAVSLRQLQQSTIRGPERLTAYTLYPALIETVGHPSVVREENAMTER